MISNSLQTPNTFITNLLELTEADARVDGQRQLWELPQVERYDERIEYF